MKGIIGTAGHIDHGKTTLIRALTGTDTDRLPEEKARGISIDLGFTRLDVGEARLGVVDVPGHEDFIRNMLAGATGIDLLLLVIAADEGVMPQTREHTAIAGLLGVERAVVALTKTDLAEPEWLALVRDDVAEFLRETPFAGAPVVPTSATTGEGIDELRAALARSLDGPTRRPDDLFRLPVDRSFTVRGTGTVVTGTVWAGSLALEERVRILPGPGEARVRGLQVHGEAVDAVEAGERAAVALAGVDVEAVGRGSTLVTDPAWRAGERLTARIRIVPGRWSLESWQRVRVHLGTAEVMARAVLLDEVDAIGPGGEGWVQLRLESPLVARAGDRLVLRSYSPVTTIGGGTVAEPLAPKRSRLEAGQRRRLDARAGGAPDAAIEAVLEEAGARGVSLASIPVVSGARPAAVDAVRERAITIGDRLFAESVVKGCEERVEEAVAAYHVTHPLRPGMEIDRLRTTGRDPAEVGLVDHALERLARDGRLVVDHGRVARAGWEPVVTAKANELLEQIAGTLDEAGLAPPRLEELAAATGDPPAFADLVALLENQERIVRLEHDLFIAAPPLRRLVSRVRDRLGGRTGLSPADFREVADVSRQHLMPLLGYLDAAGITVRRAGGRDVPIE